MQSNRYGHRHRRHLTTGAAVVLALLSLSGCMTGLGKTKVAETVADPKPVAVPLTPGEQLAAALNAKAAAGARKQGGYRDPMVRTASGHQIPLMASPGDKMMMAAADTGAPGIMSDTPTGIAGLVTQPTAVDANRTSIYSAGASASAAQMPSQQGITPVMRSVYSAPASMMQEQQQALQPAPQPESQGVNLFPAEQSSQNVVPQAAVQPTHTALPGSKPVSDATPSRMMPSPYTKGHTIDSKEALMIARSTASKQQQGEGQGQAGGQRRVQVINQPMPQGMMPGVSMTPGMAASLKQPIAFKRGVQPKPADAKPDQVMIGNLPVHL